MADAVNVVKGFEILDRETLLERAGDILDTVRNQMMYGPSREGTADMLIASLKRVQSNDPQKSPIYRVCKWLETHPVVIYKNNHQLRKAMAKDLKVSPGSLTSIFLRRDFRIPAHLKCFKRRTKVLSLKPPTPKETGAKEPAIEEPCKSFAIPPGVKEIALKANGLELVLRFQ